METLSDPSREQLNKDREAFLLNTDWSSLLVCAESFYKKFTFKNGQAAKDSFRQALKAVAINHNWATLFLEETKNKNYRDQERKLVQGAKKPERQRVPTPALASHISKTVARATLRTNQDLLLAGNKTIHILALKDIESATQVKRKEEDRYSGFLSPASSDSPVIAGQGLYYEPPAPEESDQEEDIGLLDAEMRTKDHPFFFLFRCLYDIYYNRPYSAPPEPPSLTKMQTLLFRYVVSRLQSFPKLKTIKKKDVYVAASMIAHLEMDDTFDAFGADMVNALAPLILDVEFLTTMPVIKTILDQIAEQVVIPDKGADALKTRLLVTVELGRLAETQLKGEPVDQLSVQVYEILKLMAKLCEPRVASPPKPSESMTVRTWQDIFDILFHDTSVCVLTGETGLGATREEREKSEKDHGGIDPPVSPRKVDFVVLTSVAHDHKLAHFELSDYEHKRPSASEEDWSIQVRKSLRHNHALMTRLPDIDDLVFLDIRGYTAKPVRMRQYDGVHIAGTMSEEIKLPTTPQELETFLDGQALSALCRIRERVLKSAKVVRDHVLAPKKPPLMRTLTPPPPKRARTFYTPTLKKY